mmetsp:Transcript_51009/g.119886  ORF Transcript_51009/g.119886 Transcript_51009/m.119886 type:complete len:328 (+) Transcript_51009:455-1438(+)
MRVSYSEAEARREARGGPSHLQRGSRAGGASQARASHFFKKFCSLPRSRGVAEDGRQGGRERGRQAGGGGGGCAHVLDALLGVDLADVVHQELLRSHGHFLLHRLVVASAQLEQVLHQLLRLRRLLLVVVELEPGGPRLLVQVHEHLLLQLVLAVGNSDRVVVAVEPVDQRLNRGLVQVADVRGRLARLLPKHDKLRVDRSERVDHDLPLHRLDRVNHHGHCALVESLEALLRVDVHARQPAAKARVRVVPAYDHLRPPRLLEHVEHLGLEDGVDRFDAHPRARLRHGEDVDALDGVLVHKLAEHQTHHLHRHARAAVLEHLQQRHR